MDNWMATDESLKVDALDEEKEDHAKKTKKKVPEYMQQLFEHYCDSVNSLGSTIWVNKFWAGKSIKIKQIAKKVYNAEGECFKISIRFKLKKGYQTDTTSLLMVKIVDKSLPKWIKKLECDFGVFCPQIQFASTTGMGVTQKLQ